MSAARARWGFTYGIFVLLALLAASRAGDVPVEVVAGVVALGGAGLVGRARPLVGAIAAIPGATLVVSGADLSGGGTPAAAAVIAVVAIGLGTADLDHRWSGPAPAMAAPAWPLVAGWAGAVALAVPDTEQALPVAAVFLAAGAAAVPLSLVGRRTIALGALGWWAPAGVLVWASCVGGVGRDGSAVGAVAGAGMLIAEPLAAQLVRGATPRPRDARASVVLVAAHAAVAIAAARVAAVPHDVWAAVVLAAVVLATGVAGLVAAWPLRSAGTPGGRGRLLGAAAVLLVVAAFTATPAAAEKGIVYRVVDGQELELRVDVPTDVTGERPAVVLVHGGGWRRGNAIDVALIVDLVVAQGWTAVAPDYRLNAMPGYPAEPDDIAAAVGFIRAHAKEYHVDPDRIALLGSSAGGNIALEAALRADGPLTAGDRVVAAAAMSGPTDLRALAASVGGGPAGEAVRDYLGCEPSDCPDLYTDASPIGDVDGEDPPVFLANSSAERIPADQVEALAGPLRDAGVSVRTMIVPGDRHGHGLTDDVWPDIATFFQAAFDEPTLRPPAPNTRAIYAEATGAGELPAGEQASPTSVVGSGQSTDPSDRKPEGGDPVDAGIASVAPSPSAVTDERADAALVAAAVAGVAAVVALGSAAVVVRRARGSFASTPSDDDS